MSRLNGNSLVEYYRPLVTSLMASGKFVLLGSVDQTTTGVNVSLGTQIPVVTDFVYEDVARLSMVAGNPVFSKYVAAGVDPSNPWLISNYPAALKYALLNPGSVLRLIFEKELAKMDLDSRFYFVTDLRDLFEDEEEYHSVIEDLRLEDGFVLEPYDLFDSLSRIAELICDYPDINARTDYMNAPTDYELVAYCMALVRAGNNRASVDKICHGDGMGTMVHILTFCNTIQKPYSDYMDKVSLALMIVEESYNLNVAEYLKSAPQLMSNAKLLNL